MSEELPTKDDGRTELTVTIAAQEVDAALDLAYRRLARGVTVPGFRKGKVPRGVFERQYGLAPIYEEALPEILPQAFEDAAVSDGIDPVGPPEYDVKELEPGEPLVFTVLVDTRPEARLNDLSCIEVPFEAPEITEEDVEKVVMEARKRMAELVPVEEEGVALTLEHAAVVDLTMTPEDGEPEQHSEVLIDFEGSLLPELKDNLLGATAGSVLEFAAVFPEERSDDLAGKKAAFRVLVKEIKARNLPELDEDFAQQVAGVGSAEELRETVRQEIRRERTIAAVGKCERSVVEELVAKTEFDELPEALVSDEGRQMARSFMSGVSEDELSPEALEQMAEALNEPATNRVKEKLALEAVSRAEGLAVEPVDLEQALEAIASGFPLTQRDVVKQRLQRGFARRALERDILRTKALRLLAERASEGYAEARAWLDQDSDTPKREGEEGDA